MGDKAPAGAPHPIERHEIVACLLLIGGCNATCAAETDGIRIASLRTFAYLMMGPLSGWAIVGDDELSGAWPLLLIATLTTFVPLAVYFWSKTAPPGALLCAVVSWLWWGFIFTVAIWT